MLFGLFLQKTLFVKSLTGRQRAMVATQIATMRQGDNRNASIEALSQIKAAEMMNVSRRSGVQRFGGLRSCRDTAR